MIEDDDLLEKYNAIWDIVSSDIKIKFDSETICNKEFLKVKIKSHGDEVTNFYGKKILRYDSSKMKNIIRKSFLKNISMLGEK